MKTITCFREQLEYLEARGLVQHFTKEVKIEYELSAICKKLENGPAAYFENVSGYSMPVVCGTDFSREIIANILGSDNNGLIELYAKAISNPISPIIVQKGPVKQVKITDNINLQKILPIPKHHEKNAGNYITTGLFIAEDIKNSIRNVSYHRLQVTGPAELRALILPRHLKRMIHDVWSRGESLPVAISIGNDTAARLAAASWGSKVAYGFDEFGIAGGLRGSPVNLIECETNPVKVPADSEIIIEGFIHPNSKGVEGGFAELTGLYASEGEGYIISVTAITHRENPIYQDLLVFTPEHQLLLGLPFEPTIYMATKAVVPGVIACHVTPASCGKFHAVISIKKQLAGDAKDTIIATLYSMRDIKHVVVVDSDVNIFDPSDVEWAIATRFQADRGLVIITGANGNQLDHSTTERGVTAKMGIDATFPLGQESSNERIYIPGENTIVPAHYY